MSQSNGFRRLIENAATSLGFASPSTDAARAPEQENPALSLPPALVAQLRSAIDAVSACREKIQSDVSEARRMELTGVKSISGRSASVSLSALQDSWSPKTYLPELQIEDLLMKMRSGLKGDRAAIEEIVEWSKNPNGARAPFNMHAEVIKAVSPHLASWLELQGMAERILSAKAPSEQSPETKKARISR